MLVGYEKEGVMKAVVVIEGGKSEVQNHPRPQLHDDELLVKVVAAGQNPTDWKHIKFISKPGQVIGVDFAGVVVAVGKSTQGYNIGDRVAGVTHGGNSPEEGSFAEFLVTIPENTFRIPESLSFEDAATFGVSSGTAAVALFQHLGLPTPLEPFKGENKPKLLVWGSSSGAGIFAVQLAKLAGIRVVATASPHSHQMLKDLGAEAVFDYRDPDVISKIQTWAGGELVYGLDCISEDSTVPLASNSLTGGRLVLLLSGSTSNPKNNPKVELKPMLLYTAMGKPFTKFGQTFPAIPEDAKWGRWWWKLCTQLVAEKKLKAPKVTIIGGLEDYQIGLDRLEKGQVKAEKMVMKW